MYRYFQELPHVVVENVVGWIGGEQHSQTLAALLHASQIWRFAVLPRVCRDVVIDFTSSFRPVTVRYSQWPIMNSEPDIGLVGLVRTAAVQLNLVGIIDGSTTAELLKSAERHVVYSKARELKYTVYFAGDDNDFKMLNASKPITKFLRMIEQMLPNARSVAVELKVGCNPFYPITRETLNSLIHTMHGSASHRHLDVRPAALHAIVKPVPAQGLTSISAFEIERFEMLASLLRLNARTLQRLQLYFFIGCKVTPLVFDGADEIEYPVLQKLELCWPLGTSLAEKPTTVGRLFPALCYVNVGTVHPFADNTLFRGNAVKYLRLSTAGMTLESFMQLGIVQDKSSLQNLQLTNANSLAQFAASLPETSHSKPSAAKGINNVLYPSGLTRLTVEIDMNIDDIVVLLKHIPGLIFLCCQYTKCTLFCMNDGQMHSQIEELKSRYYPASKSLQHWQACKKSFMSNMAAMECAILLALLCPRFISSKLGKRKLAVLNSVLSHNSLANM